MMKELTNQAVETSLDIIYHTARLTTKWGYRLLLFAGAVAVIFPIADLVSTYWSEVFSE